MILLYLIYNKEPNYRMFTSLVTVTQSNIITHSNYDVVCYEVNDVAEILSMGTFYTPIIKKTSIYKDIINYYSYIPKKRLLIYYTNYNPVFGTVNKGDINFISSKNRKKIKRLYIEFHSVIITTQKINFINLNYKNILHINMISSTLKCLVLYKINMFTGIKLSKNIQDCVSKYIYYFSGLSNNELAFIVLKLNNQILIQVFNMFYNKNVTIPIMELSCFSELTSTVISNKHNKYYELDIVLESRGFDNFSEYDVHHNSYKTLIYVPF